jgi:hypothetical protein
VGKVSLYRIKPDDVCLTIVADHHPRTGPGPISRVRTRHAVEQSQHEKRQKNLRHQISFAAKRLKN